MAGIYDDSPSRRMAYDDDGTVMVVQTNTNSASRVASIGEKQSCNSEQGTSAFAMSDLNVEDYVALMFPELREFDGFFVAMHSNDPTNWFETSQDSTNGQDGTWDNEAVDIPHYDTTTYTNFRDEITSTATATCTGARVRIEQTSISSGENFQTFHAYGVISPGETPDRILFLDTENSDAVFTKPLDYAEVPRGQTQTRTIKLINNSASKTINTIQITAEDLYLNAGDWYEFGDDDVSYQATFAVGNLGSGATATIFVKQEIPDGETLGLQIGRIKVSHASVT